MIWSKHRKPAWKKQYVSDPVRTLGGPERPSKRVKAVLIGNLYDLQTSKASLLVKKQHLSHPERSPGGPRRPGKRAKAILIGNLYDLRGAKQFYLEKNSTGGTPETAPEGTGSVRESAGCKPAYV